MIMNAYLVQKYSYTPAQRRRTTMVLDGQRVGDERDWVLVGFFVTCSSSAEKRFIRPAKQDEMGLWDSRLVIRVENMVTMSSLDVFEVDLNGTTSKSLWRTLLISFTSFTSPCLIMST